MAIPATEIERTLIKLFDGEPLVNIASYGIGIWNTKAFCCINSLNIYCAVKDPQTIENLRKNPRVAFLTDSSENGSLLQGKGIAHFLDKDRDNWTREEADIGTKLSMICGTELFETVKIVPYRLAVYSGIYPGADKADNTDYSNLIMAVEKRKLEWLPWETAPQTVSYGSGKTFMDRLRFWLKAARAVSFPLAVFPVVIGSMLAFIKGFIDIPLFILALAGGLSIHGGVNLISDYNDFKKGVDTPDALSSHPGILVDETVSPERIQKGAFFSFMLAMLVAGILIGKVGWPIALFAVIGIVGGYSYTGGPASYKYIGLGELLIAILMGPMMVLGAYYVQARRLDLLPLWVSLPVGLLVGSVTLANNLRDIIYDSMVNIVTLPMRLGIKKAKIMYYSIILVPYLIIPGLVLTDLSLYPSLLVFLSLPMAIKAIKAMGNTENTAEDIQAKASLYKYPLNSIKVHSQFCLLLSLGLLIILLSGLLQAAL
jgi:1,4-dihydroxy-2-naphthoate octaprenyltransferase